MYFLIHAIHYSAKASINFAYQDLDNTEIAATVLCTLARLIDNINWNAVTQLWQSYCKR